MPTLLFHIAGFVVCAALIVLGGVRLTYYGDQIATLTGMGKVWLGLVLMASNSSLPELITGISAILVVNAPAIAVGDVLGSCVFNLLMLDALTPNRPLYSRAGQGYLPAALLGILLLATATTALVFQRFFPATGWVSTASVLLAALYLAAIRLLFVAEQQAATSAQQVAAAPPHTSAIPLNLAVRRYTLFALLVVVALALPYFAEGLALRLGLQRSFVGTLMVAPPLRCPN